MYHETCTFLKARSVWKCIICFRSLTRVSLPPPPILLPRHLVVVYFKRGLSFSSCMTLITRGCLSITNYWRAFTNSLLPAALKYSNSWWSIYGTNYLSVYLCFSLCLRQMQYRYMLTMWSPCMGGWVLRERKQIPTCAVYHIRVKLPEFDADKTRLFM